MSYVLRVDVKEGGEAEVAFVSPNTPVGTYSLTGHVESEGTAGNLLGLSTPVGTVSASFPKVLAESEALG